jgi:hypothetical protein
MNKELDRDLLAFQLSQRQHKSEPDQPTTFFDHQANELSEAGGRFAALGKPRLTGRDPAPEHDSHLNQFIDGPEPPLGYSVDDLPDEIQASPSPSHLFLLCQTVKLARPIPIPTPTADALSPTGEDRCA